MFFLPSQTYLLLGPIQLPVNWVHRTFSPMSNMAVTYTDHCLLWCLFFQWNCWWRSEPSVCSIRWWSWWSADIWWNLGSPWNICRQWSYRLWWSLTQHSYLPGWTVKGNILYLMYICICGCLPNIFLLLQYWKKSYTHQYMLPVYWLMLCWLSWNDQEYQHYRLVVIWAV